LIDAYLWLKKPAESDGKCNGGPKAGDFFQARALELARNAKF
jgi:endoglucanase